MGIPLHNAGFTETRSPAGWLLRLRRIRSIAPAAMRGYFSKLTSSAVWNGDLGGTNTCLPRT